MRNHRGRTAHSPAFRSFLRPTIERLEPRCVLNVGPLSLYNVPPAMDGKMDGGGTPTFGAPQAGDHFGRGTQRDMGELASGRPMLLGSRVVSSPNSGSLSPAEYNSAVRPYLQLEPPYTVVTIFVKSLPSNRRRESLHSRGVRSFIVT